MSLPFGLVIDGVHRHGAGICRVPGHETAEAPVTDSQRLPVARIDRRQRPPLGKLGPDRVDACDKRDTPYAPCFWRRVRGSVPVSVVGAW